MTPRRRKKHKPDDVLLQVPLSGGPLPGTEFGVPLVQFPIHPNADRHRAQLRA